MQPQSIHRPANILANWVNDAPSIEVSAMRYNQVIHGSIIETPASAPVRNRFMMPQR